VPDLAEDLAAVLQHDRLDVALERVAEGIVGGDEVPGIAAGFTTACRCRLPAPRCRTSSGSCWRARLAGQVDDAPRRRRRLCLVAVIWFTASATRSWARRGSCPPSRRRTLAGDPVTDVGLVLVVGEDDLDLQPWRRPEVLDGHAGPRPPSLPRGRIEARLIVEHPDLTMPSEIWASAGLARPRTARNATMRVMVMLCAPLRSTLGWRRLYPEVVVQLGHVGFEPRRSDHVHHSAVLIT